QLIMGRRIFAFTLLTGFACYCAGHPLREILTKRNIAIALVSFACLGVASKFFVAMREASRELPTTAGITDVIKDAADIIKNSDRTDISATTTENERERTFIIGYLSELMEKSEEIPPLYGEVTKFSLATVVPSFLWREKMKYMSLGFEEAIIHPHFRLPIWDGANSLFTSGLADFGLPGCIGFPIFFGIIYSFIPSLLRSGINGIALAPLHIGFFYTLLGVEAATSSYLVAIRDLFLICVIFTLFIKLLSKWKART
ncbi:MAG TPA: hypothetical protein VFM18_01410, partial [Methanosarcina sp.]|nr:hypothetical protein [Methanosarcina sp.]